MNLLSTNWYFVIRIGRFLGTWCVEHRQIQPVRLAGGWCWFTLRENYCWLVAGLFGTWRKENEWSWMENVATWVSGWTEKSDLSNLAGRTKKINLAAQNLEHVAWENQMHGLGCEQARDAWRAGRLGCWILIQYPGYQIAEFLPRRINETPERKQTDGKVPGHRISILWPAIDYPFYTHIHPRKMGNDESNWFLTSGSAHEWGALSSRPVWEWMFYPRQISIRSRVRKPAVTKSSTTICCCKVSTLKEYDKKRLRSGKYKELSKQFTDIDKLWAYKYSK
jgi:hypothetical protein